MIDAVLRGLGIGDFDTYCGYDLFRFWRDSNELCSISG